MRSAEREMRNAKCRAAFCAAFFVLSRAPLAAQEGVAVSTAPVRPESNESRLMLNLAKDRRDSRVSLDYSIRWDFSDLKHIRPSFKTLAEGIAAIGRWDITENTRVKYYGLRTNPWRLFIARDRVHEVPVAGAGGSQMTSAGPAAPVYKKRLRLSISPLVDDFKRDLDENLRNVLLENSLKATGPQWEKVSRKGQKSFFSDLLSLDIWDLPLLDTTKEGLEYISK